MNQYFKYIILIAFFTGIIAKGEQRVFLGETFSTQEKDFQFWAGKAAQIEVISNQKLPTPQAYILTKNITVAIELSSLKIEIQEFEKGLYLHNYTFLCPNTRSIQEYLLRFGNHHVSLRFTTYPQWTVDQIEKMTHGLKITLDKKLRHKFSGFLSNSTAPSDSPKILLNIHLDENEILYQISDREYSWTIAPHTLSSNDIEIALKLRSALSTLNKIKDQRL